MRRRCRGSLTVAAAMLVLCAAGCAASSNTTSSATSSAAPGAGSPTTSTTTTTTSGAVSRGGPSTLSVSPTSGTPQSVIRLSFSSPGGAAGAGVQISQSLSIVGPHGTGCVGMHDEAVPVAPAGQSVDVSVGPAQLGGAWCPGTYTARVEVLARPKCGQGMMCPQFIRVVAVMGPQSFTIAR